jgi:hypothetical protein
MAKHVFNLRRRDSGHLVTWNNDKFGAWRVSSKPNHLPLLRLAKKQF